MEKPFVLVADDNEAICTLLTALLHRDFVVETASDGTEAIAKLSSRAYAVIVLDLLMPSADGYSVLDFLQSERPAMLSRVLVVTAALAPRNLERLRSYPICDLVRKPFEVDTLLEAVKRCAGTDGENGDIAAPFLTSGVLLLLADFLRRM